MSNTLSNIISSYTAKIPTTAQLLASTNQRKVAHGLQQVMFNRAQDKNPLVEKMQLLRSAIWNPTTIKESGRQQIFDGVINGVSRPAGLLSPARKPLPAGEIEGITKDNASTFLDALTHMGQMNEMSALLARENVFKEYRASQSRSDGMFGMAGDYIDNAGDSISDLVQKLNKPVFEQSFTAHPTNMNDLNSMEQQREVMARANKVRLNPGNPEHMNDLRKEVDDFIDASSTPRQENAPEEDINLGTADETSNMLYFLKQSYKNIGAVYEHFDSSLKAKAEQKGEEYHPTELNLHYKFSSWGSSGDKDGNKKVNAYTLLEALSQHLETGFEQFKNDLDNIKGADAFKKEWTANLRETHTKLKSLRAELKVLRDTWGEMTPEDARANFERISNALMTASQEEFMPARFKEKLMEAYYAEPEGDSKQQLLMLKRRMDIFGTSMGRIEFRETANNFCSIIDYLMDGEYGRPAEEMEKAGASEAEIAQAEAKKQEILTELLENPEKIHALVEAKRSEIENKGTGVGYTEQEQMVFHTLKRLELAAKFPQTFATQVLAECQDASNLLEAQVLMQAATTEVNGVKKTPVLAVQPLFEDPDILVNVGSTMKKLFQNPLYKAHLEAFAEAHPDDVVDGKPTQVVQFAHSDNARRGGTPASAAAIAIAHNQYREACAEAGIESRVFQGGSMSDPFRSGVRSMVGMINDYNMYDFTKVTIQNGDLMNIYNFDPSAQRFLEGIMVYQAQHKLHKRSEVKAIDDMALEVAFNTKDYYQQNHFSDKKIGLLFPLLLSDANEINSGNVGTRGQRNASGATFATVKVDGFDEEQPTMDPKGVRTITFSELLQHHLICPTWLGVKQMKDNMKQYVKEHREELMQEPEIAEIMQNSPVSLEENPAIWKAMRTHSPAFKKLTDHAAFGLAMTNFKMIHETLGEKMKDYPAAAQYLQQMEQEYIEAGKIIEMSFKGMAPGTRDLDSHVTGEALVAATEKVQKTCMDSLPHLKEEMEMKRSFLGFMHKVQAKLTDIFKEADSIPTHIARLLHAARDTITHSRYLQADDLSYRKAHRILTEREQAQASGK